MQNDINYEPKNEVVFSSANSTQTPVPTAETAILDYHQSNDGSFQYQSLKKVRGNSQASLRFQVANMGSLSAISFRIYWYTNLGGTDTAFQKTTSTTASGVETLALHSVQVTATGYYDYDFPLMACDGIKVTIQGTGTNTNSSVTNIHLALRTN